ncbi:phage minor capsid protein [Thomasclavelia cocleata]|uniref:phage minor capsid protein n=1 Tax=Thomasclavelia cocleata TaxID=69824 RepID=UPI00242D26AA|nr:phage minor capsid protein [Thomasclavelia cocleata]
MIVDKNTILKLTEPFEQMYEGITDKILLLLASYLGKDIDLSMEEWKRNKTNNLHNLMLQIKKIVLQLDIKGLTVITLNNTVDITLKDIEPSLKEASSKGLLFSIDGSYNESKALNELKETQTQAMLNTFNDINDSILNNSRNIFNKTINEIVDRFSILDKAVQDNLAGDARQKVIVDAIKKMINNRIPAFIDKASRQWSAEAYTNMYVRTNVHNLSLEAVDRRNADYGNDLFLVDSHAGARKKCYPYQNKIISNSNREGYTFDGNGRRIKIIPLSSTSYGEPDGLFGINCGHRKTPFIPNMSYRSKQDRQDKEENDRIYKESQEQRYLERAIRQSKLKEEAFKTLNDIEQYNRQKVITRQKQAQMREFIKRTGRTRRPARERIVN